MNDYKDLMDLLFRYYPDEYWVQKAADAIEQLVRANAKLNGKNELKKYEIDQIIHLTGMTYEELFYGCK